MVATVMRRIKDMEIEGAAAACLSLHIQPLNVPKGIGNQAEAEETYLTIR